MTQEKETKTVVNYNWLELLILLVFIGGSVFFGIKTSRLTEKDAAHIQKQAVLQFKLDSSAAKAKSLDAKIKVLEAKVEVANKNTSKAEVSVLAYKRKYLNLKDSARTVSDTIVLYKECDDQLVRYESFIALLKANVLLQARRGDTIKIKNDLLEDAMQDCTALKEDMQTENKELRKKAKTRGTLNGVFGGVLGGIIILLIAQ
jgi:hypothetical protein